MIMNIKNCVGKIIKNVFLEWFYLNGISTSIVRLYIETDENFYDITCCEENVFIRIQKEFPEDKDFKEFFYKPLKQNIEWLNKCKILYIKYLVDCLNLKRGILFIFENDHNFVFYNKGYEIEDKELFEIDINVALLPYNLIDL